MTCKITLLITGIIINCVLCVHGELANGDVDEQIVFEELEPDCEYRAKPSDEYMLFDFTNMSNLHGWTEQSDTVREVGMSKAAFVLQKTQVFQRAVFFSMLNPQPNGAGFAGYRTNTQFDLKDYQKIRLDCRGQGANFGYKVVLRHKGQNNEPFPSYEQMFQAPSSGKFHHIDLDLSHFEAYYRGRRVNDSEPLDTSQITNFEIQIYGGVYLPVKQAGTSSLEINYISALK